MFALSLVVELEIKPQHWEDFLDRARIHRANILANEKGVERFDILVSEEAAHTVYLYETYVDQAALDLHFETPYMKEYQEITADWVAKRKRALCRNASV